VVDVSNLNFRRGLSIRSDLLNSITAITYKRNRSLFQTQSTLPIIVKMQVGNWQPVARDQEILFKDLKSPSPKPYTPTDLPPPTTKLAKAVTEFARSHLDPKAFNHSNRIFYFGLGIIKTTFPDYEIDEETWFCTCLLHDIGLAEKFHLTTKMSFEVRLCFCHRRYRPDMIVQRRYCR